MAGLDALFGNVGRKVGRSAGAAFGVPAQTGFGSFLNKPAQQLGAAVGQVKSAIPTPAPAGPPPGPDFSVPDDYVNAYHASFANARGQIEQQFKTALQDLAGREQLSQGVVGSLPGRFAGIYNGANAQLQQQAQASLGQQKAQHLQSFAPADTGVAAQQAAMTAGAASRQADVPLVQAGVTAESSRMRGGLGQARMGALADISQREDEANLQAQRDAADAKRQWMMAQQQHAWDVEDRQSDPALDPRYNPTWKQQRQAQREDALWQMRVAQGQDAAAQRSQLEQGLRGFLPSDTSAARALALREARPAEYRRIQNSPAYQSAVGDIKSGHNIWSPTGFFNSITAQNHRNRGFSWQDAAKRLAKQGHPRAAAILRANYKGR